MNTYLNHLVTRSLKPTTVLQPRLPSHYEPLPTLPEMPQRDLDWAAQAVTRSSKDAAFRTVSEAQSMVTVSDQPIIQRQSPGLEPGHPVRQDPRQSLKTASPRSDSAPEIGSPLLPSLSPSFPVARGFPSQHPSLEQSQSLLAHSSKETSSSIGQEDPNLHHESRLKVYKAQPVQPPLQPVPERTAQPSVDETESWRASVNSEGNAPSTAQGQFRAILRPKTGEIAAPVSPSPKFSQPSHEQLSQDSLLKDAAPLANSPGKHTESPVSELRPLIPDTLPFSAAAKQAESPRLAIGHLTVEIIPTSVTPPVVQTRDTPKSAKPPVSHRSGRSLSNLRFGLSQL